MLCNRKFILPKNMLKQSEGYKEPGANPQYRISDAANHAIATIVLFLFYTAKTEKEPKRPKLVADALL
jgi:hypothetical protein